MKTLRIYDKLYDISEFAARHPGGSDVLDAWKDGEDATDAFREFHHGSPQALVALHGLPSTPLVPAPRKASNAFADLRRRLVAQGLFRPSARYYARKVAEIVVLLGAGYVRASPALLGLGLQQAGWLSHELLHRRLLERSAAALRKWATLLLGCLVLGIAPSWWVHRHSLHHAKPNTPGVDKDIQTEPLLTWFRRRCLGTPTAAASSPPPPPPPWYARYQWAYVWALLPMAKISWTMQSLAVAAPEETGLILARYLAMGMVLGWKQTVFADAWAGFFMAFVFIQSHAGLVAHPADGFYAAQARTAHNLSTDPLTTWFTGGLNYQIEHHLFPTLPRRSFAAAAPQVRDACRRALKVPYRQVGLLRSTLGVARTLSLSGRAEGSDTQPNQ